MESLIEETVSCPYCGEPLQVLINPDDAGQEYIEDCQVCCRPISFRVSASIGGELSVSVHSENDTG